MTQTNKTTQLPVNAAWTNASGPVTIRMTNDYLFRALLQSNNNVLKALICSLLHLNMEDVESVIITNPIELGTALNAKEFIMDIQAIMNNHTKINLEMQVVNEHNWKERSLLYLCRSFDNLNHGDDYINVRPAIQIGFLDFTLFPEHPEFYASYYVMNEKKHYLYSDKLRLSVIDLTQINLATKEDQYYGIHRWAALFKSNSWEEIKMIAQSDTNIQEACTTIYTLTQDEKIRQQCEAMEEYQRRLNTTNRMLEKYHSEINQLVSEKERMKSENDLLASKNDQLASENDLLASENNQLASKNDQLASEIEKLKMLLSENGIYAE
ncbi:MAG: Rpn family recombination-promoting nuclease/putative transposase [Lachnospiraceae bacterium]|nr:Rpn family recombination-promoting nuclease/putative transposase [Lachnospiraceae bacterium]